MTSGRQDTCSRCWDFWAWIYLLRNTPVPYSTCLSNYPLVPYCGRCMGNTSMAKWLSLHSVLALQRWDTIPPPVCGGRLSPSPESQRNLYK